MYEFKPHSVHEYSQGYLTQNVYISPFKMLKETCFYSVSNFQLLILSSLLSPILNKITCQQQPKKIRGYVDGT